MGLEGIVPFSLLRFLRFFPLSLLIVLGQGQAGAISRQRGNFTPIPFETSRQKSHEVKDVDASCLLTIEVSLLMVCLFYLQWGNRTGGNCKQRRLNRFSTVPLVAKFLHV